MIPEKQQETEHPLDRTDIQCELNKPLPISVPLTEPLRGRKCTDVPCLLIFLFLNACLWVLAGWSYQEGDPQRLIQGWDVNGNFCGTGEQASFPFTYFLTPLDSIRPAVCVPGCPVVKARGAVRLYDEFLQEMEQFGGYDAVPSRPFYNNYCLPADSARRTAVLDWLYHEDQVMTRVAGDLARAWDELAIAGVVTFGALMVYLISFKLRLYELHEEKWRVNGQICQPFGPVKMDDCDEGDIADGYKSLAWTTASIGFVCLLAVLCMAPFLCKADRVMQNSSRVFGFHPLPFVCPIAALIIGVSFYAFFITLIIFTTSTGESVWKDTDQVPGGRVRAWEFYDAPRVLVFFDVAMILWWLSFIAHGVEFVTACTTASWYYSPYKKDMLGHVRRSVHAFMRYHLGSVLLASVVVPLGRMQRNLLGVLKYVLRHCCKSCLGCSLVLFKPCLFLYEHWFKYMSSDGLAFMAVLGESFFQSAKKGYFVVRRHNSQNLLNSGNMVVWLFQLTVMLSGVVFCVWWLDNEERTFKDLPSYRVTSLTAMAIYELFITWFFAQVLGAYIRGVMHGSVMSYLVDNESNSGKMQGSPFAESMKMLSDRYTGRQGGAVVMTSKEVGEEKAEAAPVLAEGLVGPEGHPMNASSSGEKPLQPQVTVVPPTTAIRGKPSAVHS